MRTFWTKLVLAAFVLSLPVVSQERPQTTKPVVKRASATTKSARKAGRKPRAAKQVAEQPPTPPPPPPTPEQLPPSPPQVSYQNGQLTILSQNSTLADILNSVRQQTGARIDVPPSAASQRIATRLGPGPARDVIASLLNSSQFDYIILGSDRLPGAVEQVMLTRKSAGGESQPAVAAQNSATAQPATTQAEPDNGDEDNEQPVVEEQAPESMQPAQPEPQPAMAQPGAQGQPQQQPQPGVGQVAPGGQPNTQAEGQQAGQQQQQQQVKTPEQLLQELQRMQKQQQEQQQQQQNSGSTTPQ